MQPLYCPQEYPEDIRNALLGMSPLAREIANRWMRGWPRRVRALLAAGEYLEALLAQEEAEHTLAARNACEATPGALLHDHGLSRSPPYAVADF